MSWLAVRVAGASATTRNAISAALIDAGAACVQEDREDLITYLPDGVLLETVRGAVATDPGALLEVREALAAEIDRQWPSTVGISRAGRIVVAPPWLASGAEDGDIVITIDPAMAFGTGEHPTTRSVLRAMQGIVRPGDHVADLGSGSAVLAIAAARLGASRVAAIELDADAIGNAEENVLANDMGDRVVVIEGDAETLLPHVAPLRVVLANIISSVLIRLLPSIRGALASDGVAVFSGILLEERAEFVAALAHAHWRIDHEAIEDIWWTTVARPV
jgi:ribosomal protein L11 methyltransferase